MDGKQTLSSIYTRFYVSYITENARNGNIIYSPRWAPKTADSSALFFFPFYSPIPLCAFVSNCIPSSRQSFVSRAPGKFRAEEYTDVTGMRISFNCNIHLPSYLSCLCLSELRALAAILGPHGLKQLHEELLRHVGANLVEMKVCCCCCCCFFFFCFSFFFFFSLYHLSFSFFIYVGIWCCYHRHISFYSIFFLEPSLAENIDLQPGITWGLEGPYGKGFCVWWCMQAYPRCGLTVAWRFRLLFSPFIPPLRILFSCLFTFFSPTSYSPSFWTHSYSSFIQGSQMTIIELKHSLTHIASSTDGEEFLSHTIAIGAILGFRRLLCSALSAVLENRIPFIFHSIRDLHSHTEGSQVHTVRAAHALWRAYVESRQVLSGGHIE